MVKKDKKIKEYFADIPSAIKDIKKGKVVIVVDDPSRENEGDFVCAAEKVTP
jgi:3,4-dihydroxy 2-butanone 4-phosphate synthase/GTP cyclohydrolase II